MARPLEPNMNPLTTAPCVVAVKVRKNWPDQFIEGFTITAAKLRVEFIVLSIVACNVQNASARVLKVMGNDFVDLSGIPSIEIFNRTINLRLL